MRADESNMRGRILRQIHTRGFAPGTCSRLILHCQYTRGVILRELAPCYGTHVGANERNLVWDS